MAGSFGRQALVAAPFDVIYTGGNLATIARVLIPQNLTRGQVTMERVRGWTWFWKVIEPAVTGADQFHDSINSGGAAVDHSDPLWEGIQLVPIVDGQLNFTLNNNPVLQLANGANQESSRIIWQRQRVAFHTFVNSVDPEIAQMCFQSCVADAEIDVKVRRRWERDTWALVYTVDLPSDGASIANFVYAGHMRGLFRSPDSI